MEPHYERGVAMFNLRRYREAADEFTRHLSADPQFGLAYAMRAACLINLGDSRAAATDVASALSVEPDLSYAHYLQSVIQLNRRRGRAALSAVREALRIDPTPLSYHQLATVYYHANDFRACEAGTRDALALDPGHMPSLILRAKALSKLDRSDEARDLLRHALILEANNPEVHRDLGKLTLQHGEARKALEHLVEARRIDPVNYNERLTLAAAYGHFIWPLSTVYTVLSWMRGWSIQQRWLALVATGTGVILLSLAVPPKWPEPSIPLVVVTVTIANLIMLLGTFEWIAKVTAVFMLRRELDLRWTQTLIGSAELYNVVLAHAVATAFGAICAIAPQLAFAGFSIAILAWDSFELVGRLHFIFWFLLLPVTGFGILMLSAMGAVWLPEYPAWVLLFWSINVAISLLLLVIRIAFERLDARKPSQEI